ncbi:MAG: hypothetical protein ACKO85_05595, partial [Isosphaeraceae bacterium]
MRISALLIDRRKRLIFSVAAAISLLFVLMVGPDLYGMIYRAIYHAVNQYIIAWKFDIFMNFVFPVLRILFCIAFYYLFIRLFDDDQFINSHVQDFSRKIIKYLL